MMDKNKQAISTYEIIAKIYTSKYFDDLSDTPYIDKFLEYLLNKSKVLDVGCGPGQFTRYLMNKGFEVIGIDFSEQMLASAREKVPSGTFRKMDMKRLEFEDNIFDGLLVAYSLIHIPSEEIPETLNGFNRVLKTGGYIEIIAQVGEADRIVDEPFMSSEKMFFNFFTKSRLSKYLEDAGFEVVYQHETDSEDPDTASDRIVYTIAKKNDI